MQAPSFPIDPYLDAVAEALQKEPFVLLKAEPGAGKTTRAPHALLSHFKRILVVQPRRLAAKLAAEWVAEQSGQALGELVGYQIRLEQKASAATRLLFVTEGILTRKMLMDPTLSEFDLVILDEFHERHIHSDLALALLKNVTRSRKDLRVLVMSATLELGPLEAYLDSCQVFQIPGRTFPVVSEYLPLPTEARLETLVQEAVERMLKDPRCGGNILVFLSGIAEIMSCAEVLEPLQRTGISVIPLTAELAANHHKIYQQPDRIKIILSTNVAETSLTLPDIRGVIDSGWAKVSGFAPWSGLPTLKPERVSQASCIQRAGRAGRVAPGVCYRLFTEHDFQARPVYSSPEIRRIDVCQTLLELQALNPKQAFAWQTMDWFEAPSADILERNQSLLLHLKALEPDGRLSPLGAQMVTLPLHPRLARLVFAGKELGCGGFSLLAALVINEGFLGAGNDPARDEAECDVCYQLGFLLQRGGRGAFDRAKAQRCLQLYEQLRRSLGFESVRDLGQLDELALRKSIFYAFADRVAKYRPLAEEHKRRQRTYNFTLGRGGVMSDASVVRKAEWIVVIEAREALQDESGMRGRISWVSALDPSWLLEDPFGLLQETIDVRLDDKNGRVRKVTALSYGKLTVSEKQELAEPQELEALLFKTVKERWPNVLSDISPLVSYHCKLGLLNRYKIPHKLPTFEGDYLDLLISYLCEGARSLHDLEGRDLKAALEEQLDYEDLQTLQEYCPDHVSLTNGRRLKVHYEADGEPWLEARIQEFFGQAETPTLCRGRHALLLKLLAPSRRPAQVTRDLRGFWAGSYHEVKKELKRRYPKHPWPDDPAHEKPPEPRGPPRS